MIEVLCFKPASFCVNEPSLYPCNVVGILMKLIILLGGIFLNNHDNVVFAWIFYTSNMTINNKVADLGLIYVSLCLQYNVFLFIIIKQYNCCILFLNGLFMLFIEPQNFFLMGLICNLKGLDTACKVFNFHGM